MVVNNFTFVSPTSLVFGRGTEKQVGALIRPYAQKVLLLHYGEAFIYTTGLYDRLVQSLHEADIDVLELTGIVPNPRIELARSGIALCRREQIGFLLAVGGGSVIDTAKAISYGSHYDGDPWDLFAKKVPVPQKRIPLGVVLTMAATGSESNCQAVMTNEETKEKLGLAVPDGFPQFAILNPELTCTLPRDVYKRQGEEIGHFLTPIDDCAGVQRIM